MILNLKNKSESTDANRKLLELINKYSKITKYKINNRNPLHPYTLTMKNQKEKSRR